MPHPRATTCRMFELVEPIATVSFSKGPTDAFLALGMRNYWDGYFAGRAAPLGMAPAEVVHAIFYNFADGEVARHIPWVWGRWPGSGTRRRCCGSTAATATTPSSSPTASAVPRPTCCSLSPSG